MLTEIQACSLIFFTHTQTRCGTDYAQNDEGPDKHEDHGNQYGHRLDAQLCRITEEQPVSP